MACMGMLCDAPWQNLPILLILGVVIMENSFFRGRIFFFSVEGEKGLLLFLYK